MSTVNGGYVMTPRELRAIQLVELELLLEVDRICRKADIQYRISAGTLLGAVRHGGFIPWDDDADVTFTREEYERFRSACETELDTDRFYLQDQDNTPGYRWGYGKLRRKDSLFMRRNQEHMPYDQGIFIDLFPCVFVPESRAGRRIVNTISFFYRKAFWSAVGRHTADNPLERIIYDILYLIPETWLKRSYKRFLGRCDRKKTSWSRTLTFPTPTKDYGYKSVWWERTTEIDFEGRRFKTYALKDEYLAFKYGDYLTLPPEDKRKTHPISKLKLPDFKSPTT